MAQTFVTLVDANGQYWQITANTDGSLTQTPVASPTTQATSNQDYQTSLQTVVNLCSTHMDLMPIANVGGYTNEPALSLANDTIQELLAAPNDWKFNGKTTGLLMLQAYRQDYQFAGATAFTSQYGASIDLATNTAISQVGFVTTVNTLQPHNFSVGDTVYMTGNSVAGYNSTLTTTPTSRTWSGGWTITAVTSTSFTFTHASSGLGTSGASGISDCAWLASATMLDNGDTSPNPRIWEVQAVSKLKPTSHTGRPTRIALLSDAGTGVVTFRTDFLPGTTVYAVTINYQMKAPLKTKLAPVGTEFDGTWYPFPDDFGFVYRQAFLARCYRYLDHKRADAEFAKAEVAINKALARDDVEESNQSVTPQESLMGGPSW